MKSKFPNALLSRQLKALLVPTLVGLSLGGLSLGTGCAHQQPQQTQVEDQQQKSLAQLKSRLEEVERTNGRLNVRIEELEDQIFLLQDMTESNRIALRRRGLMQRGGYINRPNDARAQAPQPTPESYYGSGSPYGNQQPGQRAQPKRRNVTRIPLSREQGGGYGADTFDSRDQSRNNQVQQGQSQNIQAQQDQRQRDQAPAQAQASPDDGGEEVVITDEEFRRFAGTPARDSKSNSGDTSSSSGRKAQPPVTDEKLSTSDGADKKAEPAETKQAKPTRSANVDKPLDLYKVALSDYRAGDYADALTGFRAFLKAGPNANYLDNALYWIGECHYGLGEHEKAVSWFQRVLREQPDGNKVPDAMLKMSLAFERLGDSQQASALLEKLTNRYPTTNAGRLGAQKLSELQN